MMLFQACQSSLPMWAWLFLSALFWLPEVQGNCTSPVSPPHATLKEGSLKESYPVGTKLTYLCKTGYEYIPGINPSITCLNTSKWSNISSLCQEKKCIPQIIENGYSDAEDDHNIRPGDNITLSCEHGYRLVGEATVQCILKDGKVDWNKEYPICEHISCNRPDNISNGQFDPDPKDEYYIGSVVKYYCKSNFSLIGNSTLTCVTTEDGQNGTWNLPAPECKTNCSSPVAPPHATLKEEIPKEGYLVGTVLKYHCITGYEYIPGISPSITCLNTSKWSDISSLCQGKKCPAPNIENGNPVAHDDNDIRLGGNITISCVHGYRVVGEATLKCILKEGKVVWNREFPHCEHISCSRPTSILNGQFDLDPKDEYYVGSVVIYRCKPDFSLIGNSTLTCITAEDGQNGKWNLPVPECKNVKCDRPKVENGKLINLPKPSYTYNDAISFECNSGYSAVGSLHITCGANNSWVPAIPKCVKANCTSPTPPPHATLKEEIPKEGYWIGTVLTYHCITGYEYIPGINHSITCLNTSKWSHISSLCQGKKCPAPNIENGNPVAHDDNDIRLGGNITISCVHGYRVVGEATLKCILKEGKVVWNREFPHCEHISCSRPTSILNGEFDLDPKDEYYVGSVVIYRCKPDFSLIGSSTLTCITAEDGQNGKWNLPVPECKNVKCDRPKVENGKLINLPKPSYTYNDAVSFECNSGYSAVGSLHIKCGANNSWVPAIPKCVKANCTSPTPPLHATLKEEIPKEGYWIGTVLTYHCITGYEYIPGISPSIKCLNTSKWSHISSLCQGKKCPALNINNSNPVAHDDNNIRLGGSITISCVYGYRVVGEATLECILKDGKVDWNREFPHCEHISCSRPTSIPNGQIYLNPNDEYYVGSIIIYRCKPDFSLIGNSTLTCVTTEDGRNGKWNLPAPECKNISDNPNTTTDKPNTTSKDYAECNKTTALGKLIILLAVLYNCW